MHEMRPPSKPDWTPIDERLARLDAVFYVPFIVVAGGLGRLLTAGSDSWDRTDR